MRQHGVDGVAEVDAGVDEGTVEIERDKAGSGEKHGRSLTEKGQRWAVPFDADMGRLADLNVS